MKSSTEQKEPRWKRRKNIRPQEIIAAALELFVSQGYSATKVSQVARKAGVTPGTLYVYFENKEALLKAVVHEAITPVIASASKQIDDFKGSATEMIREFVNQWWAQVGEGDFSGMPKLIIGESQNHPDLARFYVTEVQEQGRAIAKQILDYGVKVGEFSISDTNMTARLIIAPMQYMVIYNHSLSLFDPKPIKIQDMLNSLINLILNGINIR